MLATNTTMGSGMMLLSMTAVSASAIIRFMGFLAPPLAAPPPGAPVLGQRRGMSFSFFRGTAVLGHFPVALSSVISRVRRRWWREVEGAINMRWRWRWVFGLAEGQFPMCAHYRHKPRWNCVWWWRSARKC